MGRKWANIVNKKGSADQKRALVYTKVLFEVTKAVKRGGEDPKTNFLLKVALEKCKKNNVPKDNIEKAIKRATGDGVEADQDINYEGYGPNGVAIFVEASTNNVTRTAGFIKMCFSRNEGTLGNSGSLQFIFNHQAVFEVPSDGLDEDDFTLEMIDVGAEEIEHEDGHFIVHAAKEQFGAISKKLEELDILPDEANLEQIPITYKEVDDETYLANMKLIHALEEGEDVVKVYHNIEYQEHFQGLE